jgi:hypothetical protein
LRKSKQQFYATAPGHSYEAVEKLACFDTPEKLQEASQEISKLQAQINDNAGREQLMAAAARVNLFVDRVQQTNNEVRASLSAQYPARYPIQYGGQRFEPVPTPEDAE